MTDEQIINVAHLEGLLDYLSDKAILAYGRLVADRAREEALEEAAGAICAECAKGNSPVFQGGLWMHPYAPVCVAGDIHDLLRADAATQEEK